MTESATESGPGARLPQRRGLGRGLGSLIPSGPLPPERRGDDEAREAVPPAPGERPAGHAGPGLRADPDARSAPHDETSDTTSEGPSHAGDARADGRPATGSAGPALRATPADWIGRIPPVPHEDTSPAEGMGPREAREPEGGSAAPLTPASVLPETPPETRPETRPETPPETPELPDVDGPVLRPVDGAWFAELPVAAISPNPRQPRQVFDEEALAELVHSVREVGLLQPVVVRPAGEGAYELIMGERRWRAMQEAGMSVIPAIVRETGDDALLRDALLENLHRAELNPLEEAAAYQQLLDDFGCTHEELAGRIGRSRPQISNTLRLLKLSPAVQRRVAAGVLSAGHARTLLGVADASVQDRLAGRVISEGISVRGLEELVAVGELGEEPSSRARRNRPTAPAVADLADRLSDLFETRVKVDLGRAKGRITIEFASLPDLERIVSTMDPTYERRHVAE